MVKKNLIKPIATIQNRVNGLKRLLDHNVARDSVLFAVGGGWEHTLNTSEKYDPQTDTWSEFETPYASQWRNLGLAVIDTKIYAVGGWDGTEEQFMNSVVSYQFLYQFFLPITTN